MRRSKPLSPGWMCDRIICKPQVGQLSRLSKFFAPVREAPLSVIVIRRVTAAHQFKAVQKVPAFARLALASTSGLNLAFCSGGREPNFESARYPPGRPALIPDGLSLQQAACFYRWFPDFLAGRTAAGKCGKIVDSESALLIFSPDGI